MANVECRMTNDNARRKAVWGARARLAAVLLAVLVMPSCSDAIRTGQTPAYLVLTTLTVVHTWEGKSTKVWVIDASYHLFGCMIAAMILVSWQ